MRRSATGRPVHSVEPGGYPTDGALPASALSRSRSMPSLADVLDTCAEDTLLAIAAALDSSVDILRLAATCRAAAQRLCFTTTGYSVATTATDGAAAVAVATQPVETWSIADEAARQWLLRCSDQS